MAGTGTGAAPECVWDDEAAPVMAAVLDKGQVAQVNDALAQWIRKDQPLPAGLPPQVRDFVEYCRPVHPHQGHLRHR